MTARVIDDAKGNIDNYTKPILPWHRPHFLPDRRIFLPEKLFFTDFICKTKLNIPVFAALP